MSALPVRLVVRRITRLRADTYRGFYRLSRRAGCPAGWVSSRSHLAALPLTIYTFRRDWDVNTFAVAGAAAGFRAP